MTNNTEFGKNEGLNINNPFSYTEELVKKIPLIGEKFSVTKETKEGQVSIEKRWTTSTKKIEIPVAYEEIYLDGKKIDSHKENEFIHIFLKIKDKIKHVFFHTENNEDKSKDTLKVKYYDADNNILNEKQNTESGKSIPLSDDKKNPKIENVITIWGEEITITKRMVKLGEFILKKYEVTETKKIDVELFTEKLTIHNPNSPKEEMT